ncbi:P52 family lipoprotein [Borreliella garinii]|nr:P52 family lipoprotein [Borreliella garinii]
MKGKLSNLKLNAVEHCVLSDMKKTINELKNNNYFKIEDSVEIRTINLC